MEEKLLLSFVIPIYNVEKYLSECLDSIFDPSADEKEYEVLAVDDGSADSSSEILKTYEHHKNFRIITQKNAGQGAARNVGIRAAKGKYIHFVDSDDHLLSGAMPALLGFARESDCDIIEFDNQTTDEEGNQLDELRSTMNRAPNEGRGKDLFVEWRKREAFFCILCIRLCKREFIIKNDLFFITGIFHEDTEWQYRCFFLAEKVIYHPIIIYSYRRREGSSSTEKDALARCNYFMKIIDSLVAFRETIAVNEDNAGYLAVQGNYIAYLLENVINTFYKAPDLWRDRNNFFLELEKRRYLLTLATSKKGRRLYALTRWLPTKIAFRMYKFF